MYVYIKNAISTKKYIYIYMYIIYTHIYALIYIYNFIYAIAIIQKQYKHLINSI